VDAQRSAELQVLLEGIPLPATRADLLTYARAQDAGAAALLERLPEGEYDRLDAVGDALVDHPTVPQAPPLPPRPESGKPPGGSAYLDANEDSGRVRESAPRTHPPSQTIEEQSALLKEQQKK
jgi:uncharacterized protein DUF2795